MPNGLSGAASWGDGMSVRTVFAYGIETEMLDCDRCEEASEPFDSAIDMGWSWLPNEDFALCDECHQDLVDIGQDVITNLLAGDAGTDKRWANARI